MRRDYEEIRKKNIEERRWVCKQCNLIFETRAELFKHNRICPSKIHTKSGNRPIVNRKCEYCGKICKFNYSYTLHLRLCIKSPFYDKKLHKKISEAQKKYWNKEQRKKASEHTVFNNFWKYRSKNPIIYESKIAGKIKLDSSWEELVAKRLDELNVLWYRPRIRLPYYDNNGVEHGYFPDFYIKDYNCFIEVKSEFIAKYQNSNNKVSYIKEHYPFVKWIETEEDCKTFKLENLQCDIIPEKDEENIDYWLSFKEKRDEENIKEKEERKLKLIQKKQELKEKKEKELALLKNSGIDFSKSGWVKEASKVLNKSSSKVGNYIRKNFPELNVFTRNGENSNAHKHWYTNGFEEISALECPDGWHPGRCRCEIYANKKCL